MGCAGCDAGIIFFLRFSRFLLIPEDNVPYSLKFSHLEFDYVAALLCAFKQFAGSITQINE